MSNHDRTGGFAQNKDLSRGLNLSPCVEKRDTDSMWT